MDPNGTQPSQCTPPISVDAIFIANGVLLIISLLILTVLTLIKQRAHLAPNCCHGYPGVPAPMDFLIAPRHRWIYVAIFGVMGVWIFSWIQQLSNINVSNNPYWQLVFKLLAIPLITIALGLLLYAPLFACVDASFTLIGHLMGLIYSMLWYSETLANKIGTYLQVVSACGGQLPTASSGSFVVLLFSDLPIFIVGGYIVIWYMYQVVAGIVRHIRTKLTGGDHHQFGLYVKDTVLNNTPRFSNVCRDYYVNHVKQLFKKQVKEDITQGRAKKIIISIWHYFVPFDRYYRLPVPFLGAIAAVLMLLYPASFFIATTAFSLADRGRRGFEIILPAFDSVNTTGIAFGETTIQLLRDIVGGIFVGLPVVVALSSILAYTTCVLVLLHMIGSISKMMKKTLQQGFTEQLPGTVRRVPSAWKFVGLLIGLCVVAWGLYLVVYLLVGVVLGAFILLLRFDPTRHYIINTAIVLGVPIAWAELLLWGQFFLCKLVFIADKDGKFVAITNRNLFNWFSLILFFYNGLAGLVKAFIRIAYSAVIGLLLLFRLDYIVFAPLFAFLDKGHRAFLGFFYLDYAYNNPVIHVFIKVLKESLYDNPSILMESVVNGEKENSLEKGAQTSKIYPRQRIRNRWLVAYTLVRNPSLLNLTSTNLTKEPVHFFESDEKEADCQDEVEKAVL